MRQQQCLKEKTLVDNALFQKLIEIALTNKTKVLARHIALPRSSCWLPPFDKTGHKKLHVMKLKLGFHVKLFFFQFKPTSSLHMLKKRNITKSAVQFGLQALHILKDRAVETLPAFNYVKPYIDTTFLVVL